jgi:hypothetical protein
MGFLSSWGLGTEVPLAHFFDIRGTRLECKSVQLSAPKWTLRTAILARPTGMRSLGRVSEPSLVGDL